MAHHLKFDDPDTTNGCSTRSGSRGRFTIVQDADLEYDPEDYARVIAPLERGEAQVVYGSRYSPGAPRHWNVCRAGVGLLNLCVWWLYRQRLTDEAMCYKAFPTELLRQLDLQCERFEFCPEVTAKVCRLGLAIREVPIDYQPRSVGDGKKIRWRDGLQAMVCLWKWRRWEDGSGLPRRLESGCERKRGIPNSRHDDGGGT